MYSPWSRVREGEYTLRKNSILVFVCVVYFHRVNDIKVCPSFYSQDLLSFDSLSRDWILKLDPYDNPKIRYSYFWSKLSLGHDCFE